MSDSQKSADEFSSVENKNETEKSTIQTAENNSTAGKAADELLSPTVPQQQDRDKDAPVVPSKSSSETVASGDSSISPVHNPEYSKESSFQKSSNKDGSDAQYTHRESKETGAEFFTQRTATGYDGGANTQGTHEGTYQYADRRYTQRTATGYDGGANTQGTHEGTYQYADTQYTESNEPRDGADDYVYIDKTCSRKQDGTQQRTTTGYDGGANIQGTHQYADTKYSQHTATGYDVGYDVGANIQGTHEGTYQYADTQYTERMATGSDGGAKPQGTHEGTYHYPETQYTQHTATGYDGGANIQGTREGTYHDADTQYTEPKKPRVGAGGTVYIDKAWSGKHDGAYQGGTEERMATGSDGGAKPQGTHEGTYHYPETQYTQHTATGYDGGANIQRTREGTYHDADTQYTEPKKPRVGAGGTVYIDKAWSGKHDGTHQGGTEERMATGYDGGAKPQGTHEGTYHYPETQYTEPTKPRVGADGTVYIDIEWNGKHDGAYQGGTEVPWVTKEFVLYCRGEKVVDEWIVIKLLDTEIKMWKSYSSEHIYKRKIAIPANYPNDIQYTYACLQRGKMYGKNLVECKQRFQFDSRHIYRDFWKEVSVNGMETHLDDILESNLELTEAFLQVETLPFTRLVQKSQNQLLKKTSEKFDHNFHEKKTILSVALCFFLTATGDGRFKEIIPPEIESKLLESYGDLKFCDLPAFFQDRMSRMCSQLCNSCFDVTTRDVANLYYSYPFLGEQLLYEKLSTLHNISSWAASEQNIKFIVGLLRKLNRSPSSGDDVFVKLSSKILQDLPYEISIAAYVSLLEVKSKPEIHETFKTLIQEVLVKRTEHKFKSLGVGKLEKVHLLWEKVRAAGEGCEPFIRIFEECLIALMKLSSLANISIVVRLADDSILFGTPDSKAKLLTAVAISPNCETGELFIKLARLKGYADIYQTLDPSCFEHWYYNSSATRMVREKRKMNVVCQRLGLIFSLKNISEKREIVDIVRGIISEEMEKRSSEQVVIIAKEVESATEDKNLLDIFHEQVSTALENSKIDLEKLMNAFLVSGVLQLNTKFIADILNSVIDKYGNSGETSSDIEQFVEVVKQRQLWTVVFSSEGTYKEVIEGHPLYISTSKCLRMIAGKLSKLEVDFRFMNCINARRNEVIDILSSFGEKDELKKLIDWNQKKLNEEERRITAVNSVLKAVKMRSIKLPDSFEQFSSTINENVADFYEGRIDGNKCHLLWEKMKQVPDYCLELNTVVQSVVYWNLLFDELAKETTVNEDHGTPEELTSEPLQETDSKLDHTEGKTEICNDYSNGIKTQSPDVITLETSVQYLEKMYSVGLKIYRQHMQQFLAENDLSMSEVLHMFNCKSVVNPAGISKPDLDVEQKVAERVIGMTYGNSTWDVLKQIYSIGEIKSKVEGMQSFLHAVQIDLKSDIEFASALESFEQLLGDNVRACSFIKVKTALGMIYSIITTLSDPTFEIMASVGESSSLIDFLKETVDEDIRNLIDAVEDISEQQVRESTVSGMIEIKQMLLPVLKPNVGENCQQLLNSLEGNVKRISKSTFIPAKINDCRDNLHNLKSLYNNVANRGEQTKQIVKNILDKSIFKFQLDENAESVLVESRYEQNGNLVAKKKTELIDLRSRSLLLMNTENKAPGNSNLSREQVETFVGYVDECIELSDLCKLLHTSGHYNYITIDKELEPSGLVAEKRCLSEEFNDWEKELSDERNRHYLMNYIHGFGLHSMYQYLNMYENVSIEDEENLRDIVQTILVFIHPDMKTKLLRETYFAEKTRCDTWTNSNWLNCLGSALHQSYPTASFLSSDRNIVLHQKGKSDSLKMTDVVQEGKLLLAQLDENSLYTVRTVIALYANTVNRMPEPHQVLFCTRETSFDEIELLLERCIGAKSFFGCMPLYCIANVELLPSELYFDFLDILRSIQEEYSHFLLAIVCRGSNSHQIIDELNQFKTTVAPATDTFVKTIFKTQHENVATLTSDLAGLGKSSRVTKHAHTKGKAVVILHVSGCSRKSHLIERLGTLKVRPFHLLHIDIGTVDDPKELDTFLFELLILGYVSVGRTSVSLGTKHVYLEIANTINETLRNSLQTTMLFSREHIRWQNFDDFVVSKEIQSAVQIVCKYFSFLEKGKLDKKDVSLEESKPLSTKTCRRLLKKYLDTKDDMSFPVVNGSIDVLADQFKKMTCSPFFRISRLQDMTGNQADQTVKSSLVKAMITSTCEFASRSVSSCRATQSSTIQSDGEHTVTDSTDTSDIATKLTQRTKGMIRWEDSNHLMFVFHCQNIQTLSPLYRDKLKVPDNIQFLFRSQMNKELQDFKALSQKQLQDLLQKIARNNPVPLPNSKLINMASKYALTPDNLLKMVLIMLRVKANVPIVIMGETGCGKTSLVNYLASICEVPFDVLNIHAGVPEETIIDSVQKNCLEASASLYSEHWLFLDEINTSESIGIMTEIICHHKCLGKSLPPNLVVMGACNPYKLRSKKDIATAGLTIKSQNDELSRLVYRVLPLPEMMVDYVWDFGSLNDIDEKLYINRMLDGLFSNEKFHNLFSDMLSVSQSFVRQKEESACVVSLRDINRCRLLTEWFINVLCKKEPRKEYTVTCDRNIRAIILALAHCYHSRFPSKDIRADYRKVLRAKLKEYDIEGFESNQDIVCKIINEEQRDFISRMELPDGTACNTALMENVFVIIVCIYNRLPVFVVGKPGCSKSLAMQIIRSNLRGKDSKDNFFKTLPQLYCVSFQGSESSTSDGILKVFTKAENYHSSNSAEDVLSVVILDEIGLAEVSRFNPLKVLHNLLEPEGQMRPNVAVVGLSNWSLDASKMNRAIHLSRTDMDAEELYETAKAISDSFATERGKRLSPERHTVLDAIEHDEKENNDVINDMKIELKGISKSYHDYSQKLRFKNFHGLRDYYALVKYVAKTLTSGKARLASGELTDDYTAPDVSTVVKYGLERNFGGLPSESSTLYEIFKSHFSFNTHVNRNVLDLIAENVGDPIVRHLMLITSGDSSLGILEQQLNRIGRSTKAVIFGSQFEDDLTDDYNYRILSRIILCMEEGIILILKDLENIYGSLYDMLNQNYTIISNKKNCRIALGAYSNPICQVANTFRCIVLMDESKVKSSDPPFLNRFEKQYLRFSDVLNTEQHRLVKHLNTWINGLRNIYERTYDYTDVFPVYSEDLLPSLVLKTQRECELANTVEDRLSHVSEMCKRKLMWVLKPEAVIRLKRAISSSTVKEADEIKQAYFNLPLHCGLQGLISSQLANMSSVPGHEGILTIVFTNSNMHISLQKCISYTDVQAEKLSTFKSEKQVSTKIQHFWSQDSSANMLFVQCSAVDDEQHIILTKSIIERYRTVYQSVPRQKKHVYLIIHTPANKGLSKVVSQINFMSDWDLVMLDSLEPPQTDLTKLCNMDIMEAIGNKRPLDDCLKNQLFWSFTRIKYSPLGRDVNSIKNILMQIKESPDFLQFLDEEIWRIVSEMEIQETDWHTKVACDTQALRNSSSFVDALEQYIMKVIKIPLTKLIFCMEKTGVLESYFINDRVSDKRRKVWLNLIHDDRIFSLAQIPDETGPECYSCEIADCSLKMPFSRIIFSHLESQREGFIEELSVTKGYHDIEENENIPKKVYMDLLVKQEKLASLSIPEWDQFCYETCEKDYVHDFSSMLSIHICSGMSREKRAYNMEWIISQKVDLSEKTTLGKAVCLHATAWLNITLFRSEMLLFAICEKVGIGKQVLANMMQFSDERFSTSPLEELKDVKDDGDISAITYEGKGKEMPKNECYRDTPADTDDSEFDSEQSEISSESSAMNAEDFLVQDICKGMIPTQEKIDLYGGIGSWQRTVNAILALAAKVSVESNLLHVLRVCNEIAGNLIIPMQLKTTAFCELGDILLSETVELDSREVFNKIVEIISAGLKRNSQCHANCYMVFSSYLVRCIMINTETEVLDFLFLYDLSNPIPDKMICHFRAPLYLAIDVDTDFDLFSKEKSQNYDTVIDESERSTIRPEPEKRGFVNAFDKFLKHLATQNRLDEPFVLLIVDLLADLFESSVLNEVFSRTSADRFRTVYDCHKEILDSHYGIRFISAVAYVRSFISMLDKHPMWDYDRTRDYWNAVNIILSDFKSNHISSTLLTHFIKTISKGQAVIQLKINVEKKMESHDFLEKIDWTRRFAHFCFDAKPFCLFIDEKRHSELNLCNGIQDLAKVEDTLMAFASGKSSNENDLLAVLSFVFTEYQLTKYISEKRDDMLLLLARFTNKVEEEKCGWHRVLKFLSGAEDFHCKGFDLERESKDLNCDAQYFLMQFFILLLSHNEYVADNEKTLFIRCLTSTLSVKECFLPGFLDSDANSARTQDNLVALATCNCSSRIAVHFDDQVKDTECVFCSESLKYESISLKDTEYATRKPNTVWKFDDIPQSQLTVRQLHPVTFQLLQLIVKGCILGSLALDYSTIKEIKEVVGDAFEVSYLLEDIAKHWSQLSKLFNLDNHTMSTLLRVIVLETRYYFCKYPADIKTETGRSDWEQKFDVKLKEILGDRSNAIKSKLRQHNTLHGVEDRSFENRLSEANDIIHLSKPERQSMLPLLFRTTSTPTKENFISEYKWRKSEFPFIDLIIQFENKLSMPRHLYNIIHWHVSTVANVSYMLKKHECLEMTVQEFFFLNPKKKDILKTRFKAFQTSWSELRSFFHETDIGSEIKHVHEATKLKECLLYNTDTVIFKVLEKLVQIQNQFLDTTLMIADRSDALHFLAVKEKVFVFPCVQITEARREDLVHLEFEKDDTWDEILKKDCLCRLEYGCGRENMYDFHSIEQMFAMKVLTGKSYIDFRHSIPNIIFADELYVNYADLLLEIKSHIKQKPLSDEIKESVHEKKNDNPKMVKDLLSHLGILMTLLKKTGGDAEAPLVDYVSTWNNVLSHEFPKDLLPNPETSVKLCHVIGLNELLEVICSETVIDALENEYTEQLDDIAKKHVIELLRDLQMANILLQALKRFVYRGVFTQTADADRPICDYLTDNSFWSESCNKEKSMIKVGFKEASIQDLLPDYLMVRHVQSLIKQIEMEIEKKEKEDASVHMREIARDFKQHRDRRNPQNKAMAKKARAKKFRDY